MRAMFLWVCLLGCTADPPSGSRPEPAPEPVQPAPEPSNAVPAPGSPVDACIASMRRGGRTRAGEIARDCAPMYREAGCRQAHLDFGTSPVVHRASAILVACARAYCPRLPEPKPIACANFEEADALQRLSLWMDLRAAIWRHELGEADSARLRAAMDEARAQ